MQNNKSFFDIERVSNACAISCSSRVRDHFELRSDAGSHYAMVTPAALTRGAVQLKGSSQLLAGQILNFIEERASNSAAAITLPKALVYKIWVHEGCNAEIERL